MLFPLILLVYLIFTGLVAEPLLTELFHLKKTWRTAILGVFLSFSFVGFLSGAAVVFYKLNLPVIITVLVVNFLVILALRQLAKKDDTVVFDTEQPETELEAPTGAWWVAILYVVLAGYGFYLLHTSQSTTNLVSPWQTIDPLYIYIFAAATLLVGALIFSKLPVSFILSLLIIHGALLHSYLPLTHQLFYGADQWRHVAVEQRIVAERPLEPAKLSAPANTLEGKVALPSGLSVGALTYSSFWGTTALLARATRIDFIAINKWLVVVLWSFVLPVLLFGVGEALGWGNRSSLFLVWLSFLPFTWQALGALTLPVSTGFLIWLLSVLLLLKRIQEPTRRQLPVLLIFGLLSLFGYTLYLILFWFGWALAEAIVAFEVRSSKFNIFLTTLLAILSGLLFPVLELVTHYSQLPSQINWLRQIKIIVSNLTGWYIATGPQAGDISTGNIIFNQLPLATFVPNILILWRWWLPVFMVVFLIAAIWGFVLFFKKQNKEQHWLAALGASVFLSYFISRYMLTGENIFTRRLDPVLALFFILFVVTALTAFNFFTKNKIVFIFLLVIFSSAITASYSLGPDTGTVSANEYKAMEYAWKATRENRTHCVIADTYPLLALEAISAKDIIGGGFPINQYFAQPELTALYRNFSGSEADWGKALRLTGARGCAFVGKLANGIPEDRRFGNIGVWWYPR